MNFNTITKQQETETVAKFNQYTVGIVMGRFINGSARGDSAKWGDLMDTTLWDVKAIKDKMKDIGRNINNLVEDELLGDTSTAFTVTDAFGKKVAFSHLECYTFLRAALRARTEAEEYKAKVKQLHAAETIIEGSKSQKDRKKEAEAAAARLRVELGIDQPAPAVDQTATTTASAVQA